MTVKNAETTDITADNLREVLDVVATITGHDFSAYKRDSIARRMKRRMVATAAPGINDYLELLRNNHQEAYFLQRELLIGVTSFFRDPQAFEELRETVLPALLTNRSEQEPVRMWLPCCSTGEEAYSLAMLVAEHQERTGSNLPVQIFATDLDDRAVVHARAGVYGPATPAAVTPERLQKFFTHPEPDQYHVSKRLRQKIVFAQHNVLQDPPFSHIDLIVCRNFLIYLIPELQKKIFSLFSIGLRPDGYLFLGLSESLPHDNDCFSVVSKKWKIFRRNHTVRQVCLGTRLPFTAAHVPVPVLALATPGKEQRQPGAAARRMLLERFAPPSVVVNERFQVIHVPTHHGGFLEIPPGEPTLDVCAMVVEGLRPALRAALHKVFAERQAVFFRNIGVCLNGVSTNVNLTVEPVEDEGLSCALVLFEKTSVVVPVVEVQPTGDEDSKDDLIVSLETQLRVTREHLNATIEQVQTANEGLMSTNEELISINEEFHSSSEELQAANEELETSREEMQTLNDELTIVNRDLQDKVDAEKRLAETLRQQTKILDLAQVLVRDMDNRIVLWNSGSEALYGYSAAEATGRVSHDLLRTEFPEPLENIERALLNDGFWRGEVTHYSRSGTAIAVASHWVLYRDEHGTPSRIMESNADISDRKKVEKRLYLLASTAGSLLSARRPVELIHQLCTQVMEILDCQVFFNYLLDEDSSGLRLNAYGGISDDQAAGISHLGIGEAVCGCAARDARRVVIENIQTSDDRRANITRRFGVDAYASHPLLVGNNVIGTLSFGARFRSSFSDDDVALMQAITDYVAIALARTKSEEDLEQARAEAVEERNMLKAVMDALPVGVSILDAKGGVIQTNSMFHQVWGGETPETHSVDDYGFYHAWWADSLQPVENDDWASAQAIRTGETVVGQHIVIQRFDGTRGVVYNSGAPYRDAEGNICGSAVAIMDVTPLTRIEEQLARRNALLQGMNTVLAAALTTASDEEFASACLTVAEKVTGSAFGFVGRIGSDGLLHDIAMSDPGWDLCSIADSHDIRRLPGSFRIHGIYGHVLRSATPFYTNSPELEPFAVGFPAGHPPVNAFLGVPLVEHGVVVGIVAVGNKTGGYHEEDREALEMLASVVVEGFARKRGEENLRRSEERYRTLFTNMTEGFALGEPIFDENGAPQDFRFVEVNEGFEKQAGLKPEMLGMPMKKILPLLESSWVETYCDVAISGKSVRFENYNGDLDRHFDVFCYCPAAGKFAILFRDITARKKAEEEVRLAYDRVERLVQERTGELEQKEALLRTVLETLPVGVALVEDDGCLSYLNPAFTGIWMVAPGGVGCDYLTFPLLITGTDFPVTVADHPVTIAFAEGRQVLGQVVDIIGGDGKRRTILASAAPIQLASREKAGVVAVIEDISEQQELQKQLLHVQKLDSIGSLAGGIAHDFNNILMVILGYAEEVRAGLQDAQLREAQDIVLSSAEKARVLTHKILAFSRQQMAQMKLAELNSIVDGVVVFIRRLIPENIAISVSRCSTALSAMVDVTQIEQVLTNIIINARDAMPAGGNISITMRQTVLTAGEANRLALQPGPVAVVAVTDTGCGIPPEQLSRIFEPFFTTKETGKGTGLGLSIAYGVMRKHGGTIAVRSVVGEGTTFTIYLPLHAGAVPVQAVPVDTAPSSGTGNILVVEDDLAVRVYLQTILKRAGYCVESAETGAAGLHAAKEGSFDLVVSDVIMPEMNGMDMYHAMKEMNPDLRVIFMSGYSSDIVSPVGVEKENFRFIQKPVGKVELLRIVQQVLADTAAART